MSKLPTKFVIAFLAIGLLVGAATMATIVSTGLKPFGFALAQLRTPFLAQRPLVQAPLQQQPITAASPSGGGGSFGHSCTGCVTTQNLADGAVTTQKIASGTVSITVQQVSSDSVQIAPGEIGTAEVACPSGSILTGGGFGANSGIEVLSSFSTASGTAWAANALNPTGSSASQPIVAYAECATIHP